MVKVKEDLTGKTFDRLTVVKQIEDYIEPSSKKRRSQWLCTCSCDAHTEIAVTGKSLKSGNTKSCGCLQRDKQLETHKKENKKDLSGAYGVIWSSNTNEEIYFDLKDAEKVLQHTWHISMSNGYPTATINGKKVMMHVFLGCKWHDHHNQNKLDNRRDNLVACTHQENTRNCSLSKNNTSGITGVSWIKNKNKWVAQIKINYKNIILGYFVNKQDAIIERLKAEKKYFGEFAPQRHLFEQYNIL